MSVRDIEGPPAPAREEALAALRGLPPLSAVAIQLQLLAKDDLGLDDVAEIIKADAALSADVLFLANSPLFGMRKTVTGIMHAVALMGLNRVMRLVITAALRSFGGSARGTPAMNRCWRHNLACGLICEELARTVDQDPDVAYTAGLLHDIGRSGMLCLWTQRYGPLLDAAPFDPVALLAAERQEFGIAHTEAGAFLLRIWRLPEVLIEAAQLHHDSPQPGVMDYMGTVHCACALADRLGFVVTGRPAPEPLEVSAPPPWDAILAGLPEEFGSAISQRMTALESYLLS